MIATFIAVGFACTTIYALRGWARATVRGEAGLAALHYAADLQHDAVELYEAAVAIERLSDEDAEIALHARLTAAAESFRTTRERRLKEQLLKHIENNGI